MITEAVPSMPKRGLSQKDRRKTANTERLDTDLDKYLLIRFGG